MRSDALLRMARRKLGGEFNRPREVKLRPHGRSQVELGSEECDGLDLGRRFPILPGGFRGSVGEFWNQGNLRRGSGSDFPGQEHLWLTRGKGVRNRGNVWRGLEMDRSDWGNGWGRRGKDFPNLENHRVGFGSDFWNRGKPGGGLQDCGEAGETLAGVWKITGQTPAMIFHTGKMIFETGKIAGEGGKIFVESRGMAGDEEEISREAGELARVLLKTILL